MRWFCQFVWSDLTYTDTERCLAHSDIWRFGQLRRMGVPPLLEKHSDHTFIGTIERGSTFLTIISVQQG
jgi:hypothetical protein